MANPVVEDASKVEPPKPNAPLEQAGKADVSGDAVAKLAKESPSYTLPKPGDADNKALTNRIDSVGSTPAIAAEFNGQKGMLLTTDQGGAIFKTADGKDTYSVKKNPENDTVTLTRQGDGQVITDAKLTRGADPINNRPDTPNPLSQTDATRSKTDAPTTSLNLTDGAAVAPVTRKDNVQGSSDAQGRAEAGQTGQTGLTGQRVNSSDAAAAPTEQGAATEVKKPVISGVQSNSDSARGVVNTENGEARLEAGKPKIPAVPPEVKAAVPPEVKAAVPPEVKAAVPPEVKAAVPPEVKAAVPPEVKAAVPPEVKAAVPPEVKAAVPPEVKAAVPPEVKAAVPPEVKAAVPPEVKAAVPPEVKAAVPPEVKAAVPPEVKAAVPPEVKAAVPPEVKAAVPPEVKAAAPIGERPTPPAALDKGSIDRGSGDKTSASPDKAVVSPTGSTLNATAPTVAGSTAPARLESGSKLEGKDGAPLVAPIEPRPAPAPAPPEVKGKDGLPLVAPIEPRPAPAPAPPEVKGKDGLPLVPVKVETPAPPEVKGKDGAPLVAPIEPRPAPAPAPPEVKGKDGSPLIPVKVETPAPPEVKGKDGLPLVPVKVETPAPPEVKGKDGLPLVAPIEPRPAPAPAPAPPEVKGKDSSPLVPVKVETPDPTGVKGKDGSVAIVPPTLDKPANPKPDPGVAGGDLHLDQKPGQVKPPGEAIVSPPADALKKDGTLKTGLDPVEKLPVGKDPVKDTLGKDPGDKTQNLNPNAPTTVSGATNQNGPTLDKAGDPGKLKALDPGAGDASQLGPMGAATGARGTGDGSGALQKVGLDGQPKIGAIDGIKDAKDPKDASLAKLNDGTKALNPLDPQNLAMTDWQNMRQKWLQNRGAMQQALLANALNPGGIPGALDMDQRHAQWLANRQAMLDVAGLSGLNPNVMTREQRMLQMNLNRQAIADGIALGALDPMQMRAMMCQQWLLQRQLLLGQNGLIGSPDYLAMRQQWLQNRLLMQGGLQDGSGALSPQDMMRQMWMLRMADFLRNQTTTDQLAMGVSGRMYQELNRVRDAAGQVEGGGRIPLSELINRRLENQQNGQFVSSLNLTPPSRLDSNLPSRADMQNLTNPGLLTSRPGFESLRQGVRPEIKGRLEPVDKTELAHKSQKEHLQDSVRKAAESVIETAAGAKAAHDAAKRIEHRIDNVILGIRQNEVENLTTQQNAANRRNSEVANVANNSNTDAALLAAITARQLKEEKDLKERLLQAEKNKKKDDGKRRKIVVKEKDTLDTICKRYLRDVRLVPLIYEINAHILQAKARIKKNGEVQLVAGTILWLPSATEVETFRGRLATGYMPEIKSNEKALTAEEELTERFGGNWNGVSMDDSTSEANKTRRQNIESLLGPLSKNDDTALYYTCRLGDTLKSIAVKHPALKDPSLWKLIAEINKLTTAIDSKGVPLAQVVRGSKIRLPDADEVAVFLTEKRRVSQSKADEFFTATRNLGAATTVVDPERPIEHKINSLKDAGALMLQAGGFKPLSEALTDPLTPTGPPTTYLSVTEFQRSQAQLLENSKAIENVRAFSDDCRIVRRHLAHFDGSRSFQAQLDVRVNGDWKVALVYNVSDTESWCQRFNQDGKVEKVKIQLPTSAIHQMLENDVNSNWQQYRDRMIG